VDEADTIFGTRKQAEANEDLRGLLNAGHQRNRPMLRWDVASRTAERLATFAMALLAAIGELPDTIMDRAVVVRMRRRGPGERVDPYRTRRDAPPLNALRERLGGWVREHLRELHHATPQMPLEDRAADTWEPLIAIADLAGGDWPTRARDAAVTMSGAETQQEEDTSAGVRLLADLRAVFDSEGADALYTTSVLERLHKLEDAPWADWYGHPLASKDLAKLLRAFDVRPKDVREPSGANRKGYARADQHEPWARYVPRQPRQPRHDDEPAGQPGRDPVADRATAPATPATPPEPVAGVAAGQTPPATRPTCAVAAVAAVAAPPAATATGRSPSGGAATAAAEPPPTPWSPATRTPPAAASGNPHRQPS
jgi:hypothetical protein